ncbi:MAG: ATP-binding protein [Methylacidiphilales bacterium]|nr:ATP-binding protein [Candidatus Methylacidiphilales bacterium]
MKLSNTIASRLLNKGKNDNLPYFLLDHLKVGVVICETNYAIVWCNQTCQSMLGHDLQEIVSIDLLQVLKPKLLEQVAKQLQVVSVNAKPLSFRAIELENGETVDLYIAPLQIISTVYLLCELTSVSRINHIVHEESAFVHNQYLRQLVHCLAHEIKNPLGGLLGATQLLSDEISREHHELTEIMIRETKRLQKLINRMLAPVRMLQEPANIHQPIREVQHLLRLQYQEIKINFIEDFDPSLPLCAIDQDSLFQVIINITQNAIEAMPQNREAKITFTTKVEFQFTIEREQHDLVNHLQISDNGDGISNDIYEKLFYPMISARSVSASGTGMGLHIAQSIMTQNGGLIKCQTGKQGTTFHLFIPIAS